MSVGVNKCIFIGRLGRDPEVKHTTSGNAVANFTVAVDETYKDRNGERQTKTEWVRMVAWGKLGSEVIGRYLTKGSLAYFEGRLQTRKYEDNNGNTRYSTEIVVTAVQMLGGGRRADESEEPAEEEDDRGPAVTDEDIPF